MCCCVACLMVLKHDTKNWRKLLHSFWSASLVSCQLLLPIHVFLSLRLKGREIFIMTIVLRFILSSGLTAFVQSKDDSNRYVFERTSRFILIIFDLAPYKNSFDKLDKVKFTLIKWNLKYSLSQNIFFVCTLFIIPPLPMITLVMFPTHFQPLLWNTIQFTMLQIFLLSLISNLDCQETSPLSLQTTWWCEGKREHLH